MGCSKTFVVNGLNGLVKVVLKGAAVESCE